MKMRVLLFAMVAGLGIGGALAMPPDALCAEPNCNAGSGCSITCEPGQGCGCIYVPSTGQCACTCS